MNLLKTNVMVFNANYSVAREVQSFRFFGNVIKEVDNYKYLGIIFSNKVRIYADNIDYLKTKANRAIADIRTNISNILGGDKPYNLMIKLFAGFSLKCICIPACHRHVC